MHPPSEAGERQGRLVALIRAERAAILTSYAYSLEGSHNSLIADPRARGQVMALGAQIIADLVANLPRDHQRSNSQNTPRRIAEEDMAESPASPAELLRAAAIFFDITVNALACHVTEDPGMLSCFVAAIRTLNESISKRVGDAAVAHTGYLLERIERANIDERRRIARDLHDQLGEGLSTALRQLELHEIACKQDSRTPSRRVATAKDALAEGMRRLRGVTSDLRQDSVRSLEEALVRHVDSVATAEADVRLRVSGDEAWAPSALIDEAFLIVREAIRNALSHGAPRRVLIAVAIAPHELRARVEDNGRGFVLVGSADPSTTGTGLVSMRERAAALGGRLTIASAPDQGTLVELLVPLPGRRDD